MKQSKSTPTGSYSKLKKRGCQLISAFYQKLKQLFSWHQPSKIDTLVPPYQKYAHAGLGIIIVFLGGFIFWACFSTLESAAVATGQIVAETKNKSIQHLEGGIIESILVNDGETVKKGQVLITLDVTKAQASLDVLETQYYSLTAEKARLIAERDKTKSIQWPDELSHHERLKETQTNLLLSNRLTIDGQLKILNQQINQLDQEIESYKAQLESETKQLALIQEEIKAVDYLYKRKLIELPKVLELKRKSAELTGNRGQYLGLISKAQQKIGETKQRIITIKDNYLKEVLDQLKEVQDKLAEVSPKLNATRDTLKRTKITAPTDGIVVGLNKFTVGGVITPSETVMQILPLNDKLIAEAQVNPNDIELIHIGQKARVYLSALKQRNSPALIGSVILVSADSFHDDKTNQSYYKVKVAIPPDELVKLNKIVLYPGMQVRVMIITQSRTPFDYFITPIQDSFRYAFREY
ncbi:HlyD family type I secretion periplasmic adaptor subunit [Legionella sp. W05-934-2]|jgi:HlyD family secretion protein/epimerase transport system membrane fusion protein|uniref:HlyD family type I secretion periplasmic adaptor subunit n=1 Tax=Legionella sp. W05-934-2 TaxID=1198649 RepID=UPI00346222F0